MQPNQRSPHPPIFPEHLRNIPLRGASQHRVNSDKNSRRDSEYESAFSGRRSDILAKNTAPAPLSAATQSDVETLAFFALLLEQGAELVVIKELLGHAHIGITTPQPPRSSPPADSGSSASPGTGPGRMRSPSHSEDSRCCPAQTEQQTSRPDDSATRSRAVEPEGTARPLSCSPSAPESERAHRLLRRRTLAKDRD